MTWVYGFLPNKTYQKLFTTFQDRCSKPGFDVDPVTVIIDFEQSMFLSLPSDLRSLSMDVFTI